jgi:hypothetical protein
MSSERLLGGDVSLLIRDLVSFIDKTKGRIHSDYIIQALERWDAAGTPGIARPVAGIGGRHCKPSCRCARGSSCLKFNGKEERSADVDPLHFYALQITAAQDNLAGPKAETDRAPVLFEQISFATLFRLCSPTPDAGTNAKTSTVLPIFVRKGKMRAEFTN